MFKLRDKIREYNEYMKNWNVINTWSVFAVLGVKYIEGEIKYEYKLEK